MRITALNLLLALSSCVSTSAPTKSPSGLKLYASDESAYLDGHWISKEDRPGGPSIEHHLVIDPVSVTRWSTTGAQVMREQKTQKISLVGSVALIGDVYHTMFVREEILFVDALLEVAPHKWYFISGSAEQPSEVLYECDVDPFERGVVRGSLRIVRSSGGIETADGTFSTSYTKCEDGLEEWQVEIMSGGRAIETLLRLEHGQRSSVWLPQEAEPRSYQLRR